MKVKCVALDNEICSELRNNGYQWLSVFSVYEEMTCPPKLMILKPHKSQPAAYLIRLSEDEVMALLSNSEYKYCVIY